MNQLRALGFKTSMVFNLDFVSNTILTLFFLFFLIIDLYFLIPAVIVQEFNPIEELLSSLEYQLKKQNQKWKNID